MVKNSTSTYNDKKGTKLKGRFSEWNRWGSEMKWTCMQRQVEIEMCVLSYCEKTFWGKSLVCFFYRIRGYLLFIFFKLCDVFCAHWNAGYQRVPVDTLVKCLMHVRGTRSTGSSLQLILQSCSSLLYVMLFLECKNLSGNNTANNNCNHIDYSLYRHNFPWLTGRLTLTHTHSAALTSWQLVPCVICVLPISESKMCRKQCATLSNDSQTNTFWINIHIQQC